MKTTRPPSVPAPGPMSMTWSARATTRRLCDHDERGPGLQKVVAEQVDPVHVAGVQSGGRLVQDEPLAGQVVHAAEVARQEEVLLLAAGEGVEGLADGDVTEADASLPGHRRDDHRIASSGSRAAAR
ncbi:hypothetical protein [Streptomyces sp. NPDC001665]